MKRLIPIAILSGFAVLFSSCYTHYSCSCSYTDSNGQRVSTETNVNGPQDHAMNKCNDIKTGIINSGHPDVQCAVPI